LRNNAREDQDAGGLPELQGGVASQETTGLPAKSGSLANLLLTLGASLIMILVGELLCRLVVAPDPPLLFQPFASHLQSYKLDEFLGVVESDAELFWRLGRGKRLPDTSWPIRGLIANAAGLREDHEIPKGKDPKVTRILFLGDSCTFGFGALHDETFVEKTEQLLKARFPGTEVEAINAGVPGYTLFQGWRLLELEGLEYQPDLIVVNFGWNDRRTWDNLSDMDHFEAQQDSLPSPVLRSSMLARQVWRAANAHRFKRNAANAVPRVSPEEFEELLSRIQQTALTRSIQLLVLVWPFKSNYSPGANVSTPYQKVMRRFGKEKHTFGPTNESGHLNLVPVFKDALETHSLNDLFIDPGHTQVLGNSIIAEAIVQKISPWYAALQQRKLE
jgi:lysophospholipase L1-like esterase